MIGYKENVLIAEFMGMESFKDSLASLHQGKINVDVDVYEQAQYHKSWDWLMPVVAKCFDIYHIEQKNDELNFKFYDSIGDIKATYKLVIEFINQLNK